MSNRHLQIVDPTRKEVQLANGPVSIASIGDLQVITFTQSIPRVEGVPPGRSVSVLDGVVLCRIAVTRAVAAQLVRLIKTHEMVRVPTAGNA